MAKGAEPAIESGAVASGACRVGVRGFKSHPLHYTLTTIPFDIACLLHACSRMRNLLP